MASCVGWMSSPPSNITSYETTHGHTCRIQISTRTLPLTSRRGLKRVPLSAFGATTSRIRPSLRSRRRSIVCARVTNRSDSKTETIVPDPDYRVAVTLLGASAALVATDNLLPAAPIGLLGLLLLVQTTRVRFVFDSEGLEVKVGSDLQESGENVFVGGKNRWK